MNPGSNGIKTKQKQIENYNNIKPASLATATNATATSATSSTSSKRVIFKSKISNSTEITKTQCQSTPSTNPTATSQIKSCKFILKKSLTNEFDDDLDSFDVFNVKSKSQTPSEPKKDIKFKSFNSNKSSSDSESITDDEHTSQVKSDTSINNTPSTTSTAPATPNILPSTSFKSKTELLSSTDTDSDTDTEQNSSASKTKFKLKVIKRPALTTSISEPTKPKAVCTPKRKIFNSTRLKDSKSAFEIVNFSNLEELSSESESEEPKPKIIKSQSLTSCDKPEEGVCLLRDTRKAYECEELGETQAFLDDLFYLLSGISSGNGNKLIERCLSSIKLAEQCGNSSEFRMSLRSSHSSNDYLQKIFVHLNDAGDYRSLSLCTSLIMFALSQDKLLTNMQSSAFLLITSILNSDNSMDELETPKDTAETSSSDLDPEEDDHLVYKKIYTKSKSLFEQLSLKNEQDLKLNQVNECIISFDCLLNCQQQFTSNGWYRNKLRLINGLDKILTKMKILINNCKNESFKSYEMYLISKYIRCLNLLQVMCHSMNKSGEKIDINNRDGGDSKAVYLTNHEIDRLNQDYILNYGNKKFLLVLLKDSFGYLFKQLDQLKNPTDDDKNDKKRKVLLTNALKETCLLLINLTHNNSETCKTVLNDKNLVELILKCILKVKDYINENEQFDILIMALGVLLNLVQVYFDHDKIGNISVYKNTIPFKIILELYKSKECLVNLAENEQEIEFKQLNEQIESQNMENINSTLMNSIHKAGKHMEEHIIAAHSALILGYILNAFKTDSKLTETIRNEIKDSSFTFMIQIIRKFIAFMKIMKVTGFSADQHIHTILNLLEELDDRS